MNSQNTSSNLVSFKNSTIHGTGGFAAAHIPAETKLIEYVGRKITKQEALVQCELDNAYIFSINDEWDIDGNVEWNPARLLNHSCNPNAEARQEGDQIWIFSLRDIAVGEEITFNYNYDLVDYKEHPCKCSAPNCVGYIVAEEFFDQVRRPQST